MFRHIAHHWTCLQTMLIVHPELLPWQRVQNAAVHLVSRLRPRDHVTSSLREHHWLPIWYRIMHKLCLTMHNAHVGRSPHYIIDSGHAQPRATSFISEQQVQTARPTYQDRRASVFVLWTHLLEQPPRELTSIMDTQTFKWHLKTHIFRLAYDCWLTL